MWSDDTNGTLFKSCFCLVLKAVISSDVDDHLSLTVPLLLFFNEGKSKKPVKLVYTAPSFVHGLSKVHVEIDACDCQQLWRR